MTTWPSGAPVSEEDEIIAEQEAYIAELKAHIAALEGGGAELWAYVAALENRIEEYKLANGVMFALLVTIVVAWVIWGMG